MTEGEVKSQMNKITDEATPSNALWVVAVR